MARTQDLVAPQVLPGGGVPGAVLTKASATDGDVVWSLPTTIDPTFPIVDGDTLIYQTVIIQGVPTIVPVPASQAKRPLGAKQMFEVESFNAIADGTLLTSWSDVSGNALDIANGGGAERPILITDSGNSPIRAVRFDGVANNLLRRGMAAVATEELTVFLVMRHYAAGGDVPWSLGRAGAVGAAAGNARGLFGGTTVCPGSQANGLGGATAHGPMNATQDGASTVNTGGPGVRRAYCYKWTRINRSPTEMWGELLFGGTGGCAFLFLSNIPLVNQFTFTALVMGAENNGGGALTLFAEQDVSYFAYYEGAAALAITPKQVQTELARLRATYQCL